MVGKKLTGLYKWDYQLWQIRGPGWGDFYIYAGTRAAAEAAAQRLAKSLRWGFVPPVSAVGN